MLVLTRRVGEEIVIGDDIRVTVVAIKGQKVRIGITAARDIGVDRQEVRERRVQQGEESPLALAGAPPKS